MKKVLKWSAILIAILFVISIITGKKEPSTDTPAIEASEKTPVEQKQTSREQTPAALPTVTAIQLAEEYEANTLAADQKYKNKQFKVIGRVADINTDLFGAPYITMEGGDIFTQPQFAFDKDAGEQLAKLKKGMKLTLVCRGKGDIVKTPMSDQCRILR